MSNNIHLKKGLNIPLAGVAARETRKVVMPDVVAVKPTDFRALVPKLLVREGDKVLAGTPVLADKMSQDILFAAPLSGVVTEIVRGEKRKLLEVRIKTDAVTEYVDFGKKDVAALDANQVKAAILEGGLWPAFIQRPYGVVASTSVKPEAIYVSAFSTAPLAAEVDFITEGEIHNIQTGIDAIAKLTDGGVHVSFKAGAKSKLEGLKNITPHYFKADKHPAGNVGVQIHNINPIRKGETVWTIDVQMLAAIGKLFNEGKHDVMKKVAITGPMAISPAYVTTVAGVGIRDLQAFFGNSENCRFVSGDALSGTNVGKEGSLCFHDNQITILEEGDKYEMLGWARPFRFNQFSTSRTYFHWCLGFLTPKAYNLDTNLHGGVRAFVVSDVYGKVLPMNLFPVYLAKACLAKDIEKMEKYGIYEVLEEDLALCEYVDPSKIDIQAIISEGIDLMIKEMA